MPNRQNIDFFLVYLYNIFHYSPAFSSKTVFSDHISLSFIDKIQGTFFTLESSILIKFYLFPVYFLKTAVFYTSCITHIQVILFEIDCAIFHTNLHGLFC